MKIAELPKDEDLRLDALHHYQILDTSREESFDQLVELARLITDCPIVVIGFIDKDRQWYKSAHGIQSESIERNLSICSHTILEKEPLVVEDLRKDDRFALHPMVQTGVCLRFYAGANIISPSGQPVGTICIADTVTRQLTERQIHMLKIIGSQITCLLEARLQTKLLRQKAEEIIALEQHTVQRNLQQHESERQQLGFRLHEGFAQTIAACATFLTHAEECEPMRLDMIRMTKKQLKNLVGEVRDCSRELTPTTLSSFDVTEMIQCLVNDLAASFPFQVSVRQQGNFKNISREMGLAIFRNVQEFLLEKKSSPTVSSVLVRLKADSHIALLMMDNDKALDEKELEKNTVIRTIFNRSKQFGGITKYKHFAVRGNALLVTLPIQNEHRKSPVKQRRMTRQAS